MSEKISQVGEEIKQSLIQVETKPGLATGWQPDAAPLGRVMPRPTLTDIESPIQIETKSPEAAPVVETKSLEATPADEYMELIQNMYTGQPIPPEVQAVYEDIQKSVASKDDVAKDAALEKLRGFVTGQQEEVNAKIEPSLAANPEDATDAAPAALEESTPTDAASEEDGTPRKAGETGMYHKFGEFEDIEHRDIPGSEPSTEGTPKEWRDKLRGLIDGAKEKVSWYKSSEEKLIRRNAELDADLDKIGGTEKYFRGLGEWYNKRNWKTKIAVGASLGLGAAFSAGVSLPIALACMSGIAAQRIAGLSTMYLKFEKNSHEEAWGKEKAFLKAAVYTAVMGLAIKEGIEYVSETESAHTVQKWLGEALGHFSLFGATHAPEHTAEVPKISASTPEIATQSAVVVSPEVAHLAAATAAGAETAGTATAPEIPGIEVTATPGHGYEYMMKRLWEQLQEKHIELPKNANPDSDLAQLLRADEKTIDGVVHRLAQDNEFFKGDGTSAHINLDSKLTIDTKGQIWLDHENILAPEDAPVTPAYHAEVPAPEAASTMIGNEVDVTSEQATPTSAGSELAVPTAEGQEIQVPVESHETPASIENFIVNKYDLSIPTEEPHIYANEAKSLFVYGGSPEEKAKMIKEYLQAHQDAVIYAEGAKATRVPWYITQGVIITEGNPVSERGLFGAIFNMKAPSPDDLKELVK